MTKNVGVIFLVGSSLVILAVVCVGSQAALAQALGDCNNNVPDPPEANFNYRISVASGTHITQLQGVSSLQTGVDAAILASDMWNEQSPSSSTFHYVGTTTRAEIPETWTEQDCLSNGVNYSLITVDPTGSEGGWAWGIIQGRCKKSGSDYAQWQMKLHKKATPDGSPMEWGVGDIQSYQWDLTSVIAHEMGHKMGLDHTPAIVSLPPEEQEAVMYVGYDPYKAQIPAQGSSRRRDAYQWDIECLNQPWLPARDLTVFRRFHFGSTLGTESQITGSFSLARASAGLTWAPGYATWAWTGARDDCHVWSQGFSTSTTSCVNFPEGAGGPYYGVWRQGEQTDRLFAPLAYDYPANYHADTGRLVWQSFSSDGFQSAYGLYLYTCDNMLAWMTCSGYDLVRSSKGVVVGWDPVSAQSITAWVNQTRLDDQADREVMLSVGNISDIIIPQADGLGVRSEVLPGLACNPFGGGYNCIAAYVDHADPSLSVRVKKFYVATGSARFVAVPQSGYTTVPGASTGSRIALWYRDSLQRYYMAIRTAYSNQPLRILSSADGNSWTIEESWAGDSLVGPSAIGFWGGNNALIYAR